MPTTLQRYEEHQFKKTISGNIETVRKGICDALENLEYAVLGDNPIQAKRKRRRNVWIATVLEYQTQLTVGLKPISEASTLATFDYEVEYLFTKGDRRTLEREADAIIALATQPPGSSICKSCGIENDTGVRFCRACGTPVGQQPALPEFELMQMSADASAAQIEAKVALWAQIFVLALSLSMIIFGPSEIVRLGWGIFGVGELVVILVLLQSIYHIRRAVLGARSERSDEDVSQSLPSDARRSMPPRPFSVTEGTTELIDPAQAPVPAPSSRDTDSI
jgi:hypothetical protein